MKIGTRMKDFLARLSAHPRWGWVVQFIQFGLVGVSNTLIHLCVYYLCVYAFSMHYQLANLAAFCVSILNAYFWNSRYVFASGERKSLSAHAGAFLKMLVSYGGTYLLSLLLLWVWVEKLQINKGVAPLLNLLVTIPVNYVLNKFWTFRRKKAVPSEAEQGKKDQDAPSDPTNTPSL